MEPLAFLTLLNRDALSRNALSALPDAPVITEDHRPRPTQLARRLRGTMALALRRAADAVAPAPSTPACTTH
jgi:hypothetical protein